jgi:hypothetical protein
MLSKEQKLGECTKRNKKVQGDQLCDYYEAKQKRCKARCSNCKAYRKYNEGCQKDDS